MRWNLIPNEIKWDLWVWTCGIKGNDWMPNEICDTIWNEIKLNEICVFKSAKNIFQTNCITAS